MVRTFSEHTLNAEWKRTNLDALDGTMLRVVVPRATASWALQTTSLNIAAQGGIRRHPGNAPSLGRLDPRVRLVQGKMGGNL